MKATNITPELMVDSIKTTVDFYTTVLDFEIVTSFPDEKPFFAIINNGGASIMLYEREQFSDEIPKFKDAPLSSTIALYIEVQDIDNTYTKVRDQVNIVQELHATDYSTKEFSFEDCNGYVLIINQGL